jgi:hypothetical protein
MDVICMMIFLIRQPKAEAMAQQHYVEAKKFRLCGWQYQSQLQTNCI